MDASASSQTDTDINKVHDYFIKIENTFPTALQHRNTVIKYTKLPDLEFNTKVSWPQSSYTLPPRLRRIVAFDNEVINTSRSLQSEFGHELTNFNKKFKKRKIVTIIEDDETETLSNYSKDIRRLKNTKAVGSDDNYHKSREKTSSRLSSAISQRSSAKTASNVTNTELVHTQISKKNHISESKLKTDRDTTKVNKFTSTIRKTPAKTKTMEEETENIIDYNLIKNKFLGNLRSSPVPRKSRSPVTWTSGVKPSKPVPRDPPNSFLFPPAQAPQGIPTKQSKVPPQTDKKKSTFSHIFVPREAVSARKDNSERKYISRRKYISGRKDSSEKSKKNVIEIDLAKGTKKTIEFDHEHTNKKMQCQMVDCGTDVDLHVNSVDMTVGTDPEPRKVDRSTEVVRYDLETVFNYGIENNILKGYENLDIPNVTLTKENSDISKDLIELCSHSLPNLDIPSLKVTSEKKNSTRKENVRNTASCIIGQATVTYTTQKKINFHVVGSKSRSTSNLPSRSLSYPINAVSVYKNEIENHEICDVGRFNNKRREKDRTNEKLKKCVNDMKSVHFPHVFDDTDLIKPSDIISTMNVNKGLLSNDYISEQFQRELHFIDSFFESLQYLENCSLSQNMFKDKKVENWVNKSDFEINNPEYDYFFSKIENAIDNKDIETMASKSLCLLNLLIRDEQRRAKNLLVVLKMREDALKDFTKSQILWLENKKRQENTDISTLKKKQRGALLRLQHECGEMQRMKKALLSLSEKRKLALMKTKKNIELKIKNNVTGNQIVLNKRKLKKSTGLDRNIAPLKCFDLSSSGCDESLTTRTKSDSVLVTSEVTAIVQSAEKSIQTCYGSLETVTIERDTETANDKIISVDGTFLNILFHQLSLPQIFSSGRNYEVKTEALKNIVNSSNTRQVAFSNGDVEKLMDKIKNRDIDKSSSPSTARSLVEELDQYYKGLADDACSHSNENEDSDGNVASLTGDSENVVKADDQCQCTSSIKSLEGEVAQEQQRTSPQEGPLPVPTDSIDASALKSDLTLINSSTTNSGATFASSSLVNTVINPLCHNIYNVSPVCTEAEELRRQQLAIEREILALEQQQNQLLVVREIPDKPPPPYTPPLDVRFTKPVRVYQINENVEQQIRRVITQKGEIPENTNSTDTFEIFVNEFCKEALEKENSETSNNPWDACNLLPQKQQTDVNQLVNQTTAELREVLAGASPTVVAGVGTRRSDHIDDILFTEWRRCEPEWTALQVDEIFVKNIIFENIFQKVLTETIDDYKICVTGPTSDPPK